MKIIIEAEPKEIAALVVAIQERLSKENMQITDTSQKSTIDTGYATGPYC